MLYLFVLFVSFGIAITTAVAGRPPQSTSPSPSPSPATLRELYAMAASQQHQQHSRLLELSNRYRGYPEIAHHVFNQQGAVTKLLGKTDQISSFLHKQKNIIYQPTSARVRIPPKKTITYD